MSFSPQKRWDWVNGFVTAMLHAIFVINNINISHDLNFSNAIQLFLESIIRRYREMASISFPRVYSQSDNEIFYLFHLEAELWGPNWEKYINFFPDESVNDFEIWETFRFVNAFFLIERWLYFFIPPEKRQSSRKTRRRFLFGYKKGVLSVQSPQLLSILGPPFSLSANTVRIIPLEGSIQLWEQFINERVPEELINFYEIATRKKFPWKILEASFLNTRKALPRMLSLYRKKVDNQRKIRALWYDVFWKYSESVRYNPLAISHISNHHPFYWNRSIRWLTSLLITGLMFFIQQASSNNQILDLWRSEYTRNPILGGLYFNCDRFC
ncbi:hypothetical protein NLC35_00850 [Candidatus Aminicenantes bacterium AC-334-K16]|jgi:hypothetical protein|nr:hypothetical protein [Candidatus Aminicenantes bacterium AC-334-K16]